MNTYTHTGTGRDIKAESARDAASMLARRDYGKSGYCRTLRLDCETEDGSSRTYEAMIAHEVYVGRGRKETAGRNVWIYETRA